VTDSPCTETFFAPNAAPIVCGKENHHRYAKATDYHYN
jgi:hypothetical protein